MDPTRLRFLFQLFKNLLGCLGFPFGKRAGVVDIFTVNRQARIVRVQGGQEIIAPHGRLSYILHVRDVDLIDIQTAVLTT